MTNRAMALAFALDPSLLLEELVPVPDPWQRRLMRSRSRRILLNCARQSGKSTAVSAVSIWTAMFEPESLVLLVSASQRQSLELFAKVTHAYEILGRPVDAVRDSATTLALANGSRIVSLPDSPNTVVGFSAPSLIVVDEAARVSDEMMIALAPMTITNHGRLVMMSTPKGRRGIWYEAWISSEADWEKIEHKASQNPRIDPAFLAEQRIVLGDRGYRQEFECSFEDTVDQYFSSESIDGAFTSTKGSIFESPGSEADPDEYSWPMDSPKGGLGMNRLPLMP